MATRVVDTDRIRHRREADGDRDGVVVYWMQQSQRTRDNPALEHAVRTANGLGRTMVVMFCLQADYPEASRRHYDFLLRGLAEVHRSLERRGIRFQIALGSPADVLGALDDEIAHLVTDAGHLPIQRRWRDDVEAATTCPFDEVEGDCVVPPALVSERLETGARTIRPRIHDHLDRFVVDLDTTALERSSVTGGDDPVDLIARGGLDGVDPLEEVTAILERLDTPAEPAPVGGFEPGERAAHRRLQEFCDGALHDYDEARNRYDEAESSSRLSPYLHYGQISPVRIVLEARASGAPDEHVEAFVEELVVRRELAVNYVREAEADLDSWSVLPGWARETLDEHTDDERPDVVSAADLEAGETDDEIWNAIMGVIRREGWVHNQLRMYWGKQILQWTNTPQHAFRTLLALNNRWFLDGRDPNSYANVAWCFGRHDRGFQEREVLGKVRPFTDQALRRKGDLDAWLAENADDG